MADTTAWIDLVSPSHPFFFAAISDTLDGVETKSTVRKKTETVDLARIADFDFDIIGRDFDNPLFRKIGIPLRTAQLAIQAPQVDVSLSSRNAMCVLASKANGIPSIHFTDNDITAHVDGLRMEELYNRLEAQASHNVVPAAFETDELTKWGADSNQIHTYDGYKENVYIATFQPDDEFLNKLPFDDYVVVRPEALGAAYVDVEKSIVPQLLELFVEGDVNVVYLPRGRGDTAYVNSDSRQSVYVPNEALDGLQLAWYAKAVLTGSGTMAREAACMQKPAVSFFPNSLLSVDELLVEQNRVFHSRDPSEIVDYVMSKSEAEVQPSKTESKAVLEEVASLVKRLIMEENKA